MSSRITIAVPCGDEVRLMAKNETLELHPRGFPQAIVFGFEWERMQRRTDRIQLDLRERRGGSSIQNGVDVIERCHTHVGPALNRRRPNMWQ